MCVFKILGSSGCYAGAWRAYGCVSLGESVLTPGPSLSSGCDGSIALRVDKLTCITRGSLQPCVAQFSSSEPRAMELFSDCLQRTTLSSESARVASGCCHCLPAIACVAPQDAVLALFFTNHGFVSFNVLSSYSYVLRVHGAVTVRHTARGCD